MKKTIILIIATAVLTTSCSSNGGGDEADIHVGGITISDDADCCSAEEALAVYNFLQTLKPVGDVSLTVDGAYDVQLYTHTGSLHVGYNDLYFVATKKASGNYIKFLDITRATPLMTMPKMGNMQHSTPVSSDFAAVDINLTAVKHGWVSFLMPTSDSGSWTLGFEVEVLKKSGSFEAIPVTVEALPEGQSWLKSFKVGDDTYFLSLANPNEWQTGANSIRAYVSKKSAPITQPYALATELFTIDIDPRMPDMGNHTSPDNTSLTRQPDGSYLGTINLTMTGLWRIHLTVKDQQGNIVAGGEELSSLYWDVTI